MWYIKLPLVSTNVENGVNRDFLNDLWMLAHDKKYYPVLTQILEVDSPSVEKLSCEAIATMNKSVSTGTSSSKFKFKLNQKYLDAIVRGLQRNTKLKRMEMDWQQLPPGALADLALTNHPVVESWYTRYSKFKEKLCKAFNKILNEWKGRSTPIVTSDMRFLKTFTHVLLDRANNSSLAFHKLLSKRKSLRASLNAWMTSQITKWKENNSQKKDFLQKYDTRCNIIQLLVFLHKWRLKTNISKRSRI